MKSKYRLGIRGRFFLAFGALSALTLLASIISWMSYNRLGDGLNQVVEGNIHTLSLMADLKEKGTKITLIAPTLLAVKNEANRQNIRQDLNLNISIMAYLLPQISAATQDHQAQKNLSAQIETLKTTLVELDNNVFEKLKIQQQKRSENQRLRWVASSFLSDINRLTENEQRYLYSLLNQESPDSWLTMNNVRKDAASTINADLQRLYRIKADVNLLINLVDRAQHLPDLNSLIATQAHSDEIIQRIKQDIEAVGNIQGVKALKQTIVNIVFLTRGEHNMFTIRSRERAILQSGELLLSRIREELGNLNQEVAIQTDNTEAAAQVSAQNARETIKKGRIWMLLMVAASLLFSILIVWLYVGKNMVGRITSLDASMRSIANGNLDEDVQVKGSDEIGTMARSLVSFRDQLATLQEDLVQAGKLAALGQLSAGIAHEINQPLSAIGHYSHNGLRLIKSGRLDETEKNLNQISNLTKRATTIITRLKSLARKQQDNLVKVDLRLVIDNVLSMLEGDEVRKLTSIDVNFDHDRNLVNADSVQLEQVVLNLVTNALDAINDQPEKHITIDCLHQHDRFEIYVRDNGPGISKELREQIFEPFFTTKRRGQSLGLGLSISYNIIKSFGGKLTVDDGSGNGASFCIQLPEYRRSKP
ncbi:ATP-binding protein [Neptunomonas japonica]|uniref:C4-dicarboxylate transport sensor protein DctB n=1 Tax=Neptunomonas japonica JAMM 1380 TaxID=1441457 RepID=A0A7R6PU23_9GAMM|nr:ATP-binding protein [Neptunomonas japonica]BBB30470.1 two-component system, NtrC family, C4-dicarboxylate transport sensor histidine kinase DctB [Neptunomonas japonica JAMM 1380]